jgi:hypothetical protein
MYNKIKYWLTILYQNAKKEYSERPIATTGVLVAVIGVLFPLLISESLRGFVVYLLSKVLLPQIEVSLFPLITIIIVLLVAFFISKQKREKTNYHFIVYDPFTWKITYTRQGAHVDPSPYCKVHQVKMLYPLYDLYVCPLCGIDKKIELPQRECKLIHTAVKNIVEADVDGHIKD